MINHPRRSKAALTSRAAKKTREMDFDAAYIGLMEGLHRTFRNVITDEPLAFTTNASGIWDIYLAGFPKGAVRQHFNCSCCRKFVERFGGLVRITPDGHARSVMWNENEVPESIGETIKGMRVAAESAAVTGMFLTTKDTWGTPQTGEWHHLYVHPPKEMLHRDRGTNAGQASAALRENRKTVLRALMEYRPEVIDEVLRVLATGLLERSDKFVGPLRWLRKLHDTTKNRKFRNNILWHAVANAPAGYCHVKSSVVGPLLDDVAAGVPFEDIQRKHAAKMHPLRYQRPQLAPTIGNVKAAEDLVEKLGIARSLERRTANIEEVLNAHTLWVPTDREEPMGHPAASVFGHLNTRTRGKAAPLPNIDMPAVTMTWEKFARTVLPDAERIDARVPLVGDYIAMVTAVHADAPPILKWDREEERNPFSWYVYNNGSPARQWGLAADAGWASVLAVVPMPTTWSSTRTPIFENGVILLLKDCSDQNSPGMALFPEVLKSELHGIRSSIEALSKSRRMASGTACGLCIRQPDVGSEVRVWSGVGWTRYLIDRWD